VIEKRRRKRRWRRLNRTTVQRRQFDETREPNAKAAIWNEAFDYDDGGGGSGKRNVGGRGDRSRKIVSMNRRSGRAWEEEEAEEESDRNEQNKRSGSCNEKRWPSIRTVPLWYSLWCVCV
jgi:hypothetical protein